MTDEQPVTVVTAVMNRGDQLLESLPSWLALDQISEIIIVDWSSSEPVAGLVENFASTKIHVIRVDGEADWHLAGAFNTGLRHVTSSQVMKLDADHKLQSKFFSRNLLPRHAFVAGDWRAARVGQAGLNGFVWAWADDLFAVGGWDERIRGYGWDDSDLTDRLQAVGLHKRTLARSSIKHVHHSSHARNKHEGVAKPLPPRVSTQINKVLTARRVPWRRSNFVNPFPELSNHFDGDRADLDAWIRARVAVSDDLRPFFGLAKRLWRRLLAPAWHRARYRIVTLRNSAQPRRTLVVHVRHGLGNRLRTLAAAAAIAKSARARLIVAWIPDEHCGAGLLDLIDYRGAVISSAEELGPIAKDRRTSVINLMDDATPNYKHRKFRFKRRVTLVRSSSVIRHPAASPVAVGRTIATWSPSPEVGKLVRSIGSGFDLALQIRQGIHRGALTPSYDRPAGNWSESAEAKLHDARAETWVNKFQDHLRSMVDVGELSKKIRVYLCADSPEASAEMTAFLFDYGVTDVTIGGNSLDRSREGVLRAMADCIVLASATNFVRSPDSSLPDLVGALRLEFGGGQSPRRRFRRALARL